MDPLSNPLATSSLGAVILLMAMAMRIMFNEIKRLNSERLKDIKEARIEDRKVIQGVTKALTNLKSKIDGMNGGEHV